MRKIGLVIRFLIFVLLVPALAVITFMIFVSNFEFLFLRKRREETAHVWGRVWRWTVEDKAASESDSRVS